MCLIDEIWAGISKLTVADFFSVKDYFYATVSAVAGCYGGITWAKREAGILRARLDKDSISGLVAATTKLKELAEIAESAWSKGNEPNFPFESQRIIALNERVSKYEDGDLRGALEGLAYQCSHYNSKLTVVSSACLDATLYNSHTALLTQYKNMMKDHAADISRWATSAIEKLKKETNHRA